MAQEFSDYSILTPQRPLKTVTANAIHNSGIWCCLFDPSAGRNATSLVYWLLTSLGWWERDG